MDEDGCIARGEGRGGIYRALRECVVSKDHQLSSPKAGKLKKKDEIVVLEWRLLASPPVLRVRSAEGWCTEREMDGALNLEHVHGARVGESDQPREPSFVASPLSGRRKSVSVMSAQEKQALRRASVEVAQQQLQTHLRFRDGHLGGASSGDAMRSLGSRRLLSGRDGGPPTSTATTCVLSYLLSLLERIACYILTVPPHVA